MKKYIIPTLVVVVLLGMFLFAGAPKMNNRTADLSNSVPAPSTETAPSQNSSNQNAQPATNPADSANVKEVSIVVRNESWGFEPNLVNAKVGDKLTVTVDNQDSRDHGFAVDAFGVNERIAAGTKKTFTFVVDKSGDFEFYCSIPCGSGEVDGERRGHHDMTGTLHVS
jgi:cytochrome c oxidase subunit 2